MTSYISGIHVGHGIINRRWTGLGVNRNSKVVASITEVTDPGGEPMLGTASLTVQGVAPNDAGELWIKINVDWGTDLHYRLTAFVE